MKYFEDIALAALLLLGLTVLTLLLAGMQWRYLAGIFAAGCRH